MPSPRSRLGRRSRRTYLPSLYDRYPRAAQAVRRSRGLQVVVLDQIVGTVRHPSQNTADFLPLSQLRGRNWMARWQRIRDAVDRMDMLPAVDLLQVGDEYFVADGHNRIAAALEAGAAAVDADVIELRVPGVEADPTTNPLEMTNALEDADELQQAVRGGQARTAELRSGLDRLRRDELLAIEQRGLPRDGDVPDER